MRRSPGVKQQAENSDGFVSKKLAEVSKVIQKEHLHKDASALFSSSFEKDLQLQVGFVYKMFSHICLKSMSTTIITHSVLKCNDFDTLPI